MQLIGDPIPHEQLVDDGAELRDGHGKTTAIIRSSMAIASIIASSVLIWIIRRSHVGLSTTYHRLLLGMCIADILFSLSLAHFNIMAPSDDDYFVWNARGNLATCSAQGFAAYAGALCGLMYNCSLNLYYLAVVKYQKSDGYIRRKVEPFLHGAPVVIALASTATLLAKKNANDDGGGVCFDPVYEPPHCIGYEDGQIREGFEIPCGRGRDGALIFRYLAFFLTLFGTPIFVGISLGIIYRSVLQQERKMSRYGASTFNHQNQNSNNDAGDSQASSSLSSRLPRLSMFTRLRGQSSSETHERKSRTVMYRAVGYSIAYLLTWSFIIVRVSLNLAGIEWPIALWYLTCIFNPLQGLYNLLIFLHPKVLSAKRSRSDNLTWYQAFSKAFWSRGIDVSTTTRGRGRPTVNNNMQQNSIQQNSPVAEQEEPPEAEENVCSAHVDEIPQIRRRSSEII